MRKAMSVVMASGMLLACAGETPDPTASFTVPVFSHAASASASSHGGNFGTPLSGAEEVPARPTKARGSAIFQLNAAGDTLTYQLIVANIENVFMAHIHREAVGANGPIVVWLYPSTAPVAGPVGGGRIDGVIAEGTITAADLVGPLVGMPLSALLNAIRSGNAYVNAHTNDGLAPTNTGPGDFPGGEIRGQVEHRGH
ncbi:MAG: CHRD domain-containing protein [Candidatus Rokuibacteriota bacterium]